VNDVTEWKTESIELMKVLSDPRRMQILELAVDPITVKELADAMEEKPSRLYYHVNKLQETGMLKVVDTKQTGNLVEKYYQADHTGIMLKGDVMLQAENLPITLAAWQRSLIPGLRLYEKSLEKVKEEMESGNKSIDRYPYHISVNRATIRMTAEEWRNLNIKLIETIRESEGGESTFPEEMKVKMTPEEAKEVGTYQYILMAYRIEDALKLGLVEDEEE